MSTTLYTCDMYRSQDYYDSDEMLKEDFTKIKATSEDQSNLEIRPNALWFGVGSQWYEWFNSNGMSMANQKHTYQVEIPDTLNILKVDTIDKVLNLQCKFQGSSQYTINWEKVKSEYDGVEFYPYLKYEMCIKGLNIPIWYYGLDFAGGYIWNLEGIKATYLGISDDLFDPSGEICNRSYHYWRDSEEDDGSYHYFKDRKLIID